MYSLKTYAETSNKAFFERHGGDWADKAHIDKWADHIRKYYQAQLNVDYRTIDEATFSKNLLDNMNMDNHNTLMVTQAIKDYVAWVKKNHVITKGYADPENSLVSYASKGPVFLTHFKFMIIQADDTAQTFLDKLGCISMVRLF